MFRRPGCGERHPDQQFLLPLPGSFLAANLVSDTTDEGRESPKDLGYDVDDFVAVESLQLPQDSTSFNRLATTLASQVLENKLLL